MGRARRHLRRASSTVRPCQPAVRSWPWRTSGVEPSGGKMSRSLAARAKVMEGLVFAIIGCGSRKSEDSIGPAMAGIFKYLSRRAVLVALAPERNQVLLIGD